MSRNDCRKKPKSDGETEEHFNNRLLRWEERKNKAYEEWDELCRQREAELENYIQLWWGDSSNIRFY